MVNILFLLLIRHFPIDFPIKSSVIYFEKAFVKVIKNKAYFKRFQVKFKRRRGK